MNFVKRLSAPSKDNRYYYRDNVFYNSGYGMPNCTCYAWGRFYELTGMKPKLCTRNAEEWYKFNDGYKRGSTPKLGAIAVWSKGVVGNSRDGGGHVSVVEEIYSDGSILTSNSAYHGSKFYTAKVPKGYKMSNYKFEGFIYLPTDSSNNKIKDLQIALNKSGANLEVDGIIGIKTSNAIKKYFYKSSVVKWVQENLNSLGYNSGVVDGVRGKNTKSAIKKYQSENGLKVDGIAGIDTIKSICNK